MNTRLMMGGSAAYMAALGLVASFAPQELLSWLGVPQQRGAVLITETVGARWGSEKSGPQTVTPGIRSKRS